MRIEYVNDASQARLTDLQIVEPLVEQAKADGVELVGPGGLLHSLTKTVLEAAREVEMSEHPGHEEYLGRPMVASLNGTWRVTFEFRDRNAYVLDYGRLPVHPESSAEREQSSIAGDGSSPVTGTRTKPRELAGDAGCT